MPKAWSDKDERQYKHIKAGEKKEGRSTKTAERIAAATVNKQRSKEGRAKTSSRSGGTSRSRTATSKSRSSSRGSTGRGSSRSSAGRGRAASGRSKVARGSRRG